MKAWAAASAVEMRTGMVVAPSVAGGSAEALLKAVWSAGLGGLSRRRLSSAAVLSGFKRSDASFSEGEPCAPCPWRTQHARALAKLLCPEVTSGEPCRPVDGARAGRRPPPGLPSRTINRRVPVHAGTEAN